MIHIGIADYGMNARYGQFYDYEERMDDIKKIGYEGCERLSPTDAADALQKASYLKGHGMSFATCNAPTIEKSIKWTAALGGKYIWCSGLMEVHNLNDLIIRANYLEETCERYGICCAIHNHLASYVETQEQLEEFLDRCPGVGMILDIGHLNAAGGNVKEVFNKYYDRIKAIHLKDWVNDEENPVWIGAAAAGLGKGHFCALGKGLFADDNKYVVEECVKRGFDGWIHVEQDTHLRDPLVDLAESRELIRSWGL
ncbi:MAG: sugar phosphate isomerase/epimerase [Ruminococcaceae bacterium]|nr:sugar phosphate isomerase/epimerase [Oscillospiraceae bacterium]